MLLHHLQAPLSASHPVRGAWIEIARSDSFVGSAVVASRKGCVD